MTAGLVGVAIDSEYAAHMDINTDEGLALTMLCLLRLVQGGLVFLACNCSSLGLDAQESIGAFGQLSHWGHVALLCGRGQPTQPPVLAPVSSLACVATRG